ncbi:hypothetical protein [Streptomyces roseoviridis]|uniref:Uncharacterized protein n=1 Tax=Streptomyces roseoviridis TaxID=67361 RepID=A0ABV5QZ06_9ACTN
MHSILIRLRGPAGTGGPAQGADALAHRFMTASAPGVEHVSLQPVTDGLDGIVFVVAPTLVQAVRRTRTVCETLLAAGALGDGWWLQTCQADMLNVSGLWLPARAR